MSAIGPGDWLRCVAGHDDGKHVLYVGEVYRVARLRQQDSCAYCGRIGLIGLQMEGEALGDDSWCPARFVPVDGPPRSLIESLKAPPKVIADQPKSPSRTPQVVGAGSRDTNKSGGR